MEVSEQPTVFSPKGKDRIQALVLVPALCISVFLG